MICTDQFVSIQKENKGINVIASSTFFESFKNPGKSLSFDGKSLGMKFQFLRSKPLVLD